MGAPDILIDQSFEEAATAAQKYAETGRRGPRPLHGAQSYDSKLPDDLSPLSLILLDDTVRDDAPEILKFFSDQGVELKVISGDNTATVATVAERAGVPNAHLNVDARTLD